MLSLKKMNRFNQVTRKRKNKIKMRTKNPSPEKMDEDQYNTSSQISLIT